MGQMSVPVSGNGALILLCLLAKQPSAVKAWDLSAGMVRFPLGWFVACVYCVFCNQKQEMTSLKRYVKYCKNSPSLHMTSFPAYGHRTFGRHCEPFPQINPSILGVV